LVEAKGILHDVIATRRIAVGLADAFPASSFVAQLPRRPLPLSSRTFYGSPLQVGTIDRLPLREIALLRTSVQMPSLQPLSSAFSLLREWERSQLFFEAVAAVASEWEGRALWFVLSSLPMRRLRSLAGRDREQVEEAVLRALEAVVVEGEFVPALREVLEQAPISDAPTRIADPFSLERARGIDAKAGTPLLAATIRTGAWATERRRARGRLGGLLAAFGQYQELGGLRRRWEPFCAGRLERCLPPMRPRLLLSSGETAALIAVPEESAQAPVSFREAPSRRVAPVAEAPSRGLLLGRSDHSGSTARSASSRERCSSTRMFSGRPAAARARCC
jgi:hypothetical protein